MDTNQQHQQLSSQSRVAEKQLFFYARMAGLSYLVFCLSGFLMNFLFNRKFTKVEATDVDTIFQNEMHFRMASVAETIIFIAVLVAGVYFYRVCRGINSPLAQIALCCRLVEATIGGVAVLVSTVIITLANSKAMLQVMDIEQLRTLVLIVAHANWPAYEYSFIFMGIAGIITFSLLMKAKYLAKFWCIWGMITYASMIAYSIAKVLFPELPKGAMYVMMPGAIFEVCVSIWLMAIGINFVEKNDQDVSQPVPDNAQTA